VSAGTSVFVPEERIMARRTASLSVPPFCPPDSAGPAARAGDLFFETTDVDLLEDVLSSSYADMRIDAHGQRGGVRMTRSGLGPPVRLDRNQWTLTFDVTAGAPLGFLAIGHLRAGRASCRSGADERRYGPGDVFLTVPPEDAYTATIDESDNEVTVIDPALVTQIAGPPPGRADQPVRFTGYEPVSAQAARTWKTTSAYIRDTVRANPEMTDRPLLSASMAQLLAATALATFPSDAQADPTAEDRHDAHPATLRRAIAFIDEHAHEDITAADIAAAAHVTVRAVQLAFRRHLGTTPMNYLRRARLEAAHRDLLTADPARTTVTAVAYRWGFASSSRFAAVYRQTYGLSPSHTLHQG
jgi:AraC-like DNA-binding protein